jgi:toxin ParE1/3/4
MKVRFTQRGLADLSSIGSWIASDSPEAARKVVSRLRNRARSLSEFPERHPVFLSRVGFSIRRCVEGGYLIFSTITDRDVLILRILHAARDPEAAGFSEP